LKVLIDWQSQFTKNVLRKSEDSMLRMNIGNGVNMIRKLRIISYCVSVPVSMADSTLDPDPGYHAGIGIDSYKYAFKIPTLRNINKTAPYMHNGIYQTLDQVMEFYNNGGAAGLGINLPNQTLSAANLHLTKKEKEDIIAFMKSLETKQDLLNN